MSVLLKKLNHYSKYTADDIAAIKEYVRTKGNDIPDYPADLNTRQKKAYQKKFGQHWVVIEDRLYYHPNRNLYLEAIAPEHRQEKLAAIYNDPEKGLGIGLRLFYYQVCQHYVGITREETSAFLKKQGDYQLGKSYKKIINKPVLAQTPNERWAIDIMDMGFFRFGAAGAELIEPEDAIEGGARPKKAAPRTRLVIQERVPLREGLRTRHIITEVPIPPRRRRGRPPRTVPVAPRRRRPVPVPAAPVIAEPEPIPEPEFIDFGEPEPEPEPEPIVADDNVPVPAPVPAPAAPGALPPGIRVREVVRNGERLLLAKIGQREFIYPVNHNQGYRYILMVIDYFSKKVFARALRTRNMAEIITAVSSICEESQTFPHILQSDNEFNVPEFNNWCAEQEIQPIHSTTYNPVSNGLVERYNQEMWKKIRAGFIRNNNLEWAQHLPHYVANVNSQRSSITKYTAEQLWKAGYTRPRRNNLRRIVPISDTMTNKEKLRVVQQRLVNTATNRIRKSRVPRFDVGDRVRISLKLLETKVRKRIKDKRVKTIVVRFTPEIYTVSAIHNAIHNRFGTQRESYELTKPDGTVFFSNRDGNTPRLFFAADLQKVADDETNLTVPDIRRSNQLNQTAPYRQIV